MVVPALAMRYTSLNRNSAFLRLRNMVRTSTYAVALHVFEYRYLFVC